LVSPHQDSAQACNPLQVDLPHVGVALGSGLDLGLVLGSFFRVSQKYSVESIILTHKKTALRRWLNSQAI